MAAAVAAQVVRVALRVHEHRQASALRDFFLDPAARPADLPAPTSLAWPLAGILLVLLVIMPLQGAAIALWVAWHRRVRRNAADLGQPEQAVRRRGRSVVLAVLVLVAAKVGTRLVGAGRPDDVDVIRRPTVLMFEIGFDVAVLGLLVVVGVTTARVTAEQHRRVLAGRASSATEPRSRAAG